MDRVPAYLVVYLLKIRKHSGESGYLERRLEGKSQQRAVYEKAMLEELSDLHLIAVTDKEHDIVFNPLMKEVEPGFRITFIGEQGEVAIPSSFVILARGHYLWLEWFGDGFKWFLAALFGGLIARLIG